MRSLKERVRTAIVFITHDLAVVAGFVDRVVVMYAGVVVESAPVRRIFREPQHPYTQGLLASVPALTGGGGGGRQPLRAIPGHLPDPRPAAARLPVRRPVPAGDAALHGGGAGADPARSFP